MRWLRGLFAAGVYLLLGLQMEDYTWGGLRCTLAIGKAVVMLLVLLGHGFTAFVVSGAVLEAGVSLCSGFRGQEHEQGVIFLAVRKWP